MAITEKSGISIAEIIVYTPALFVALWLSIRHGFKKSEGWIYLLIFSTVRIVGAALQLAAANSNPTNTGLYIGAATLQSIGLTPLILALLGLLSRVLTGIRHHEPNFLVVPRHLKLIGLIVTVALVLGSIGSSQARKAMPDNGGAYVPGSLSKAGTALVIVAYILLAGATALCGLSAASAEPGEKRLLLAVAAALPFVLVRLVYAAVSMFGNSGAFSIMSGDVNVRLGMATIMEMVVVAIIESIGLTVQKQAPMTAEHGPLRQHDDDTSYPMMEEGQQWKHQDNQYQHQGNHYRNGV